MALIPIPKIREARPDWPYSEQGTWRLIRLGELECVQVGRRKFLTLELIEKFIAEHVTRAALVEGA